MTARLAGALALVLFAVPASAQQSCEDWNTLSFFRSATAESVAACLDAGADVNARTDSTFDVFFFSGVRGGYTPLHSASFFSGDRTVALLLAAGAEVDARDLRGRTPLHGAAGRDWDPAAVVAELVEAGADLNARDGEGNTPLHVSRRNRNPIVALLLLEFGADPALVNDSGQVASPMDCSYWNTEEFARVATADATAACLEAGADVNARDENGNTPLLLATGHYGGGTIMDGSPASEDPAIVTALLEAGADVDARDAGGNTALGRAAGGKAVATVRGGMLDLVEIPHIVAALLAAGAEVNPPSGTTPLHRAAFVEGMETVAMLIEAGADIHARDGNGDTPLLRAADYGGFRNPETLEALVGAGADVNDRSERGETVLKRAMRSPADRVAAVVRRLLELGADAREPGLLGEAAVRDDNPELVGILLAAGADPNARGRSPLHMAASRGGPAAIAALAAGGAAADARDAGGRTPLHRAIEWKKPANVAALIEAGADVHALFQDGDTPLHMAAKWPPRWTIRGDEPSGDDTLMVVALAAAGADIDARNDRGETPLHVATRNGHQPVVDKLLALGADPVAADDLGRAPRPAVCDWTKRQFFRHAPWESVIGCLQAGADVHARGEHGETPLHRLVSDAEYDYPFARVVAAFVDAGADVNEPDRGGGTPLHDAAGRFHDRAALAARALLEAGAEANARDGRGATPLHRLAGALFPQDDSLAFLLVEAGADVHGTDEGGRTALHHAVRGDNPAIAARLIELGADVAARDDSGHVADPLDCARFNTATFFHLAPTETVAGCIEDGVDVNARLDSRLQGSTRISGSTPLHFASAGARDPAIVSLLVQAGAEVNALDNSRGSPLHSAARSADDPAVIVALAEAGAELDAWVPGIHSPHGWTPLHYAVQRNGNPAVAAALIEAGADIHARQNDGPTPLHDAATAEAVALLLKAGADIEARASYLGWRQPNGRDMTPLHVAAKRGNAAVFTALLEAGADPTARDVEGRTPLDHAGEQKALQELESVKRSAVPASAQEDCDDWNTHDFFHSATAESVTACLEAGADLDARHEVDRDSPDGGNTPLHFASRYSWDPAVFTVLIEAGADVEARNVHGRTPLHLAAQGNRPVVVSQLAEAGADLDARDRNGNTPLHASARGGYPPVAHLLLELGADPALVNDAGRIADPMSCDHWNTEVFARIATAEATAACLEAGADVNARDEHGNTPLLLATSIRGGGTEGAPASDDPAVVTVLLEAGADVNARDGLGNTPLLHTAGGTFVEPRRARYDRADNPAVMAALLAGGADLKALSATGATPLHQAASVEGVETVAMLLEAGADVGARDSEGDTPLLKAAYGGFRNPAVLETLVAAGADVNERNDRGATVLEHTLRSPSERLAGVVRRLLELGADVNATGLIAPPLVHAARQGDDPELIAVLLAAGADVNASSRGGPSPLHGAAYGGGPGAIAALVAHGGEVNARDARGLAPLHRAVEMKAPANVAALLDAGADVHVRTRDGDTPLHLAAMWPPRLYRQRDDPPEPDTLMVVALAAAGAEVDARNDRGQTPLHVATRNGHRPVVDKLLALGADPAAVDDFGRAPRLTVCDWTQRRFFRSAPWQSVLGCLQAGADVHARGESGATPLHRLASDAQGDPERGIGASEPYGYPFARVVAAVVEAGADVNAADWNGSTPLHAAAGWRGGLGTARVAALLDAGADVHARDSRGATPLHQVAGARSPRSDSLVSLLVEAGADLDARDDAGRTALHDALRNDNPPVAARLIELGADTGARDDSGRVANPVECARFNTAIFFRFAPAGTVAACIEGGAEVNSRSDWGAMTGILVAGSTPLHIAARWARNPATVSLLLQAGAEVNARNDFRLSPLHEAARGTDDPAMIAALVEAGAELEVWTISHHGEDGLSPLHEAVEAGHPSVVAALLEAGADVHARHSDDGPTPLHRAGNPEVAAMLLEAGADIDARAHFRWPFDFPGMTPLHAAARWGRAAVFLALLEAGADPEARDPDGRTPMDLARENRTLQELEVVKRSGGDGD